MKNLKLTPAAKVALTVFAVIVIGAIVWAMTGKSDDAKAADYVSQASRLPNAPSSLATLATSDPRYVMAKPSVIAVIVGVLGIEGPATGRLVPAVEVGFGGGARVGVALRRAMPGRR